MNSASKRIFGKGSLLNRFCICISERVEPKSSEQLLFIVCAKIICTTLSIIFISRHMDLITSDCSRQGAYKQFFPETRALIFNYICENICGKKYPKKQQY